MASDIDGIAARYARDGYCFPLAVMNETQADTYRTLLERAQAARRDDPLDRAILFSHANFVLPFVDEITRLPAVLEPVKAVLGPDLLVWGANFFIKEPHTSD